MDLPCRNHSRTLRLNRAPPPRPIRGVVGLLERCTFPGPGTALTCGVSGGADSLALFALAVAAGCRVTAVHVDHGLRPGSAAEADLVAGAARTFGADFRAERVTVTEGPNLEDRARRARHAALGPDAATGHTADDQAETVLANLLRGAGRPRTGRHAGRPAPPAARAPAGRHRGGLPIAWAWSRCGTRATTTRGSCAIASATSCCRCVRPSPAATSCPCWPARPGCWPGDADLLDALASVIDPEDAGALAAAPEAAARRSIRGWLTGARATTRPRSTRWTGCSRSPGASPGHRGSRGKAGAPLRGAAVGCTARRPRSGRSTPPGVRYSRCVITAEGQTGRSPRPPRGPGGRRSGRGVPEADLQARIAELGARITADYAGSAAAAGRRAEGGLHVHERPVAGDLPPGRRGLHGGVVLRQRHPHLGRGAHRQRPRRGPGRPPRAGGRGHRRQRAHPQLSAALSAGPSSGQPRGVRAAGEERAAARPTSTCAMSDFTSPPSSWWATGSMSPNACATSAPSTPTPATRAKAVRAGERRHRAAGAGRHELLRALARTPTATGW